MTIEAGVLSLKITETGADTVLTKLGQIDAKAKALGTATMGTLFNAPSATGVNGQLGQMSVNLTKVGQAATTAAPALEKQATAQANVAKTAAAVGAQTGSLTKAAGAFTSMTAGLAAMGVTLTAGAILSGIVNMTRNAIDAGDAMHDLAMRTGVSTQALSIIGQVAAKSGADGGVLTVGLRNLAKSVEALRAGNKEAVASFGALGLSAKDLEGLSLDQVFVRVADAQEKFADGSGKTADMVRIFGRAGDQLIPTLHELADGGFERARDRAEALGSIIGPEFADKADKFNDTLEDMHSAIGGLGIAIATSALPQMTAMAEMLTQLITKGREWLPMALGIAGRTVLAASGPLGWMALWKLGKAKGAENALDSDPNLVASIAAGNTAAKPDLVRDPLAAKAAEEARIARLLARTNVGMPGVTGIIGQSQLGDLMGLISPVGTDSKGKMKGVKAFGLADVVDKGFDALTAKIEERRQQLGALMQGVGDTIGGALASGFTAAFTGGNFFAEIGKALISGLGSMIVQLGSSMLTYGLLMAVGAPLLMATPFAAEALSAPAAIAAGTGLIALGAGMGAIGGGGGKGGGGGGSAGAAKAPAQNEFAVAFDPDRKLRKSSGSAVQGRSRGLDSSPMPEARPVVHIGTINSLSPDDAKWQRAVAETYTNARNRGLVRNG